MSDTNLTLDYFQVLLYKYRELSYPTEPLCGLCRLLAKLISQLFLIDPLLLFCFHSISCQILFSKASVPEDSKSILPSAENLISNLLPPPERNFPRYSLLIIRIEIRNIAHWKSISRTPNPAHNPWAGRAMPSLWLC